MAATLEQLIRAAEQRRAAADQRAKDLKYKVSRWAAVLDAQDVRTVPPEQEARADEIVRQYRAAVEESKEAAAQLAAFHEAAADERDYAAAQAVSIPTAAASRRPAYDRVMRVGREERTYHPDRDREAGGEPGTAFLLDAGRAFLGDPGAAERLAQHQREEEVERPGWVQRSTSANFAGLVVPAYITDMAAPAVANMRPLADIMTHHDLPPVGMTVNLARVTTPTAAGLQTTENTAVTTQDLVSTLETENVQTAAGSLVCSRQAIERGVLTEELTSQDLLRRLASVLDLTLLTQATTGADAQATTNGTTAFTTTAPTAPLLWPKLFAAQAVVEAALLGQAPPTHFLLHPRRFNWLVSQVSSSWPLFGGAVPAQLAGAVLTNEYGTATRMKLANGMLVTVDANIPTNLGVGTNQDEIFCLAQGECHIWESPDSPVLLRCEQPSAASLGILYVAYEFFSYSFRRYPGAIASVTGTGLVTPVFA